MSERVNEIEGEKDECKIDVKTEREDDKRVRERDRIIGGKNFKFREIEKERIR